MCVLCGFLLRCDQWGLAEMKSNMLKKKKPCCAQDIRCVRVDSQSLVRYVRMQQGRGAGTAVRHSRCDLLAA